MKIQESNSPGDILVFLTGKEEIMQAVNTLDDYNTKNPNAKYACYYFNFLLVFSFIEKKECYIFFCFDKHFTFF